MACFSEIQPDGTHILIFVAGQNQAVRFEVRPSGRMDILFGTLPTDRYRNGPSAEDMTPTLVPVITEYLRNAADARRITVTHTDHIKAFVEHVLVPVTAHKMLRKLT